MGVAYVFRQSRAPQIRFPTVPCSEEDGPKARERQGTAKLIGKRQSPKEAYAELCRRGGTGHGVEVDAVARRTNIQTWG